VRILSVVGARPQFIKAEYSWEIIVGRWLEETNIA
jgi:hypothetical protein